MRADDVLPEGEVHGAVFRSFGSRKPEFQQESSRARVIFSETPASETPASETPASETPASETPASETPASETPASETPASETPASETPAFRLQKQNVS